MRRWIRSLHAQLFLWAILPVTFVIIALAFTGVYAHQRTMQDFVAERDLSLARMVATIVEDGLAHGVVDPDGAGLANWTSELLREQTATVLVVSDEGTVLAHPESQQVGADLSADDGVMAALAQREGAVVLTPDGSGPMMTTFASVTGIDWVVLVQEPVEELIGPILRFSSLAPIVAVGAGIVSLLVLVFGWRTIVRPLQALSQAAGEVTWGDYSAINRPLGGVQEVRELHLAVGEMVDRIQGYEAGMQDYLGAVTQGQEDERARIAQELHDGPVQDLIALGQQAEIAQRLVERGETDKALAVLAQARQAELKTVDELRRMIGALRPVYLEDLGLASALEMLVGETAERSSATIELHKQSDLGRFAPEVELAAYRVAQEALNNAIQHAQAKNIGVRIQGDADGLTLSVFDDGVGFALPLRPDLMTRAGHFGLVGMQERVTRLGGTLQVDAAPGAGTRITVHLPHLPPAA